MGWTNNTNTANTTGSGPSTMDWITSGIVMASNIYSGYETGKANEYVNKANARMNEIKADAVREKAWKEDLYSNEEQALQGWGVDREYAKVAGARKVAQAGSGTYGPGDDRLEQDAQAKLYRQKRNMLRALQLESFERNNAATIAAIGYKGKARQYRIAAKNSLKAGVLSGVASGLNDATKYMTVASTFWKKGGDTTPVKSAKTKTVDKAIASKYNPNKLNLYTTGSFTEPTNGWKW